MSPRCPNGWAAAAPRFKFLDFRFHVAYHEHARCIAVIAVKYCRDIHIDYVSVFQIFIFARDAVTYHLVYGRAHAFRESFIVERCGRGTVIHCIFIYYPVYLGSGHAFVYFGSYGIEHSRIDYSAHPYAFYLLWRLYHFPCRHQMSVFLVEQHLFIQFRRSDSRWDYPSFSVAHFYSVCYKEYDGCWVCRHILSVVSSYLFILAQVSFSETVRLNISLSLVLSLSGVKYPILWNWKWSIGLQSSRYFST